MTLELRASLLRLTQTGHRAVAAGVPELGHQDVEPQLQTKSGDNC